MSQGRVFSREFKLAAVRQVASGAKRPAQICREHGIAESVLLRWRHEYEARGDDAFTPRQRTATEALERKVAEPERFCGQLALENAALQKGLSALPSRNGTR
jgi:transposase